MVLLLTDEDVRRVLTMRDAMDGIEDALREHGAGQTIDMPRSRIYAPNKDDGADFWMNTMACAIPGLGVAAMRLGTGITRVRNTQDPVILARKTDRTFLYEIDTGEMVAIVHNDYLQNLRVGATTGVAARYLARADASAVGVFGSGRQARTNLIAIALCRPITRVRVHSPTQSHCEAYCREMSEVLGIEVAPATPREIVQSSDIVLAATNSRAPVFDGAWLRPGTHVISILAADAVEGGHELDRTTLTRADLVVVNSIDKVRNDSQARILELINEKLLTGERLCELADIVAGKRAGRTSDAQLTVYDNNVGMGLQFAACAALAWRRAVDRKIGRVLEDRDFNEYRDGSADIGLHVESIAPNAYSKAAFGVPAAEQESGS